MDAVIQSRTPTPGLDSVLEALRTKDKRKNKAAVNILCGVGSLVIKLLAIDVTKTGILSDHRIRLLNAILQIGGPLGPEDYDRIATLLKHRSKKVRVKAAEVLFTLSPMGPPPPLEVKPIIDLKQCLGQPLQWFFPFGPGSLSRLIERKAQREALKKVATGLPPPVADMTTESPQSSTEAL